MISARPCWPAILRTPPDFFRHYSTCFRAMKPTARDGRTAAVADRGRIVKWSWLGLVVPAVLSGCATQNLGGSDHPAFLLGLFHGFTAIVALAGSVFFHIR